MVKGNIKMNQDIMDIIVTHPRYIIVPKGASGKKAKHKREGKGGKERERCRRMNTCPASLPITTSHSIPLHNASARAQEF
jgi:hypothetical protein